jgi:hypothetical protein
MADQLLIFTTGKVGWLEPKGRWPK